MTPTARLALALLACALPPAWGQTAATATTADAQPHIAQAWALYRQGLGTEFEDVTVQVQRPAQPPDTKQLSRWTRFSDQGDRVLIKFQAPASDRGLGLLIHRKAAPDASPSTADSPRHTQMWLRQPSWPQARKIAADRESRYFGGTDLNFEDNRQLLGEAVAEFQYRHLPPGGPGWLVEATPRDGTTSAYGKRWIRLSPEHAVTEIQYFDPQGRLIKTQRHENIRHDSSGRWRADRVVVHNLQENSQTVFSIQERRQGQALPDRLFNPQHLSEE